MAKGRMLNRDISTSARIADLSGPSRELFFMLIPHYNAFGKMNGSPFFIKGEIVPLIKYFTIEKIKECLTEISQKTNVKWFEINSLFYIHSLNWAHHQDIRPDRRGVDELPSYKKDSNNHCGSIPGLLRHEVEDQVEVEVEDQGEDHVRSESDLRFESFYEKYPKKTDKKDCALKWKKLNPSPDTISKIMEALSQQIQNTWANKDKNFIPSPLVWLNKEKWNDEIIKPIHNGHKINRIVPAEERKGGIL